MANPEHLAKLKQGVKAWNNWLIKNMNFETIPFSCEYVSDANLYIIDLRDANLRDADLRGANLRDADLRDADLRGANLSGAHLVLANLSGAHLEGADLKGAHLVLANLRDAHLEGADLYDADLKGADLKGAHLYGAYLEGADLKGADLVLAHLYGADLYGAHLKGAHLERVQALATNFEGATLTGACIEDWHINSQTNLQNVKCDYIFLKYIYSKQEGFIFCDRRPHDPNKNFAPGEFTKLFQKALETVDLIFSEGIEWTAFLESFQQLQAEIKSDELSIQAIEKKSGGAFIIRLEVPADANKAEIEKYTKQEYDAKLKVIEANYQKQLQAKDETIQAKSEELIKAYREKTIDLLEMAKILATNQPDIINKISVVSGDSYNTETAGIVHNEGNISGNAKVAGKINEAGQQEKEK